ncbi:hypothetical protein GC169_05260 [bacterium]|nr:hypothetical protein [bacterium]
MPTQKPPRSPAPDPAPEITRIARVMHEAVRAWQMANGQEAAPPWSRAPAWMKTASREAVVWRLAHRKAPASAQHDQWADEKLANGWRYGKVKDGKKKTHPLLIPYEDLPEVERQKDTLVAAVVLSLAPDAASPAKAKTR